MTDLEQYQNNSHSVNVFKHLYWPNNYIYVYVCIYIYSPQHLVLRHPQLPFLPQCQWPSFTPIQNNIYIYIYFNQHQCVNVLRLESYLQQGTGFCFPSFVCTWSGALLKLIQFLSLNGTVSPRYKISDVKLNSHMHLVTRLRMRGVIPPISYT